MWKRTIFILFGLFFVPLASAHAQGFDIRPYVGAGIGAFGLELKNISQKNTVFGGFGKLGADIGDYLGAELRVGATSSGTTNHTTFSEKLSADYFVSYLAKFQYPVTSDLKPYALVGGTTAKFKGTNTGTGGVAIGSATKTGFSYGFGADYYLKNSLSVGGEWVQYWSNISIATGSDANIWGAVATVAYHF